jgi:hypothetical protein
MAGEINKRIQQLQTDLQSKKLAAAAKKPGKLGQRARLAQTLKGMKK